MALGVSGIIFLIDYAKLLRFLINCFAGIMSPQKIISLYHIRNLHMQK